MSMNLSSTNLTKLPGKKFNIMKFQKDYWFVSIKFNNSNINTSSNLFELQNDPLIKSYLNNIIYGTWDNYIRSTVDYILPPRSKIIIHRHNNKFQHKTVTIQNANHINFINNSFYIIKHDLYIYRK